MVLKLYYNLMSQPSRSLYIVLKASKTPFEDVILDLTQGEQYMPEFTEVNRFQKVPCIDHDGFLLSESVAIVKYLRQENLISPNLFPCDLKTEARVNEFLSWHHIGIRAPCALYFWAVVLDPVLKGKPTPPAKIEQLKKKMNEALDIVEEKWLGQGNKYIAGNSLTVADVFGCCEIEQPTMANFDPTQGRPNLAAWMQRVKSELSPHYDDAHVIVKKIARKGASKL